MVTDLMLKAWEALKCIQRQCWEQGLASQAALAIGKPDEAIMMAHDCVLRQGGDGRLALIENTIAIGDPAASGAAVKYAFEITGQTKYKVALDKMTQYLLHDAPRSPDGAIYQLQDRNHVWIDSFGMVPPYLAMVGEPDAAMTHIRALIRLLWNEEKQLFSHMYDADHQKLERAAFWTSGNGWALFGMAHTILNLGSGYRAEKEYILYYFKQLAVSMREYQLPNGLMYDVIDDSNTFIETNGSQMYAYALYIGISQNWIDKSFLESANRVLLAARQKVDAYGFVQDAAGSPDFCRPGTSAEAQVFYLLMETTAQVVGIN